MQISLKQTEIVAALKMYIAAQGINLADKTVKIDFTAGRKEAGITADVSIEGTLLDQVVLTPLPKLAEEPAEAKQADPVAQPEAADAEAEAPKVTSLFGA